MAEEDGGDGMSCIVADGVGLRELGVELDDEEEADVAIFVGRCYGDVVNADSTDVMHECLG